MKPISFQIPKTYDASIRVQIDEGESFYSKLHLHPEYQITAIQKGAGLLMIENEVLPFEEGSVFIIGSNASHLIKNDTKLSNGVRSVSLFFRMSSFGEKFFDTPELSSLRNLLKSFTSGISYDSSDAKELKELILKCEILKGVELFQQLIAILDSMVKMEKPAVVNSHLLNQKSHFNDGRWNILIEFISNHYHRKLTVKEVATTINLSPSQFSRYFKTMTRKSFITYLNDLRIEKACGMLKGTHDTIETICFDVGFANVSHFNRSFKGLKGLTPSEYRNKMNSIASSQNR